MIDTPQNGSGNLAGHARMRRDSPLRPAMRHLHGIAEGESVDIPLAQALEEAQAIEALASVLESSLVESRKEDGTIDHYLQAARVLRAMRNP